MENNKESEFEKFVRIFGELRNDKEVLQRVLHTLIMQDMISISELVSYSEYVKQMKIEQFKEDLSNASALLLRHIDKINTENLKEDSEKFVKKQGFFKV